MYHHDTTSITEEEDPNFTFAHKRVQLEEDMEFVEPLNTNPLFQEFKEYKGQYDKAKDGAEYIF